MNPIDEEIFKNLKIRHVQGKLTVERMKNSETFSLALTETAVESWGKRGVDLFLQNSTNFLKLLS